MQCRQHIRAVQRFEFVEEHLESHEITGRALLVLSGKASKTLLFSTPIYQIL
jgi:hypothetical protein